MKIINKKAISLIVLIITIIVMIVLAGVIIISLENANIIDKASDAVFRSDMKNIIQSINVASLEARVTGKTPDYNSIIPQTYRDKMIVLDNAVVYICDVNSYEANVAKETGYIVRDKSIKNVCNIVSDIEKTAKEYVAAGNSTTDTNILVTQYIRNLSYTGNNWTTIGGTVDTTFINTVNENLGMTEEQIKNTLKELKDPVTGKVVDFIHAMASLNGYLYNKNKSQTMKTLAEYSAWAGDLCTLMEQIVNYTTGKAYTTPYTEQAKTDIEKYIDSMLGTNLTNSTFGISDMLADADAVVIYKMLEGEKQISDIIYDYYLGTDKCKERYVMFAEYLTELSTTAPSINTVTKVTESKAKVAYLFMGKTNVLYMGYASAITSTATVSSLTDELCAIISNKFSQYIQNNM